VQVFADAVARADRSVRRRRHAARRERRIDQITLAATAVATPLPLALEDRRSGRMDEASQSDP
jgi:hypothetical protein